MWVVRDDPRKRAADYRREEWVPHAMNASEVDAIARRETRGHFCICAICGSDEPEAPLRAAYKALDYRLGSTETLMVHSLARIPAVAAPFPVHEVSTQEIADRLAKAAGRRQVLPEHFAPDSPLRQYVTLHKGQPIAWARRIKFQDSSWVSNVFVAPAHRRKGIASSILARMLRDDRSAGTKRSVLLASHTGALLYARLGYEQIGQLLVYTPRRRR
jgi:GNAT superfamily N-acetyltransferase